MRTLALLIALAPVLVACGADEEVYTPVTSLEEALAQARSGDLVLTDDLMEEFVGIAKALRAAGADGSPNPALLQAHGWDLPRYLQISQRIGLAMAGGLTAEARSKLEGLQAQLEEKDALIALQEEHMDRLTGVNRERVDITVQQMREQRDLLARQVEAMRAMPESSEQDSKNMEVLRRWLPKLEALGQD